MLSPNHYFYEKGYVIISYLFGYVLNDYELEAFLMLKLYQFSNRSIEIISLLFTGILAICGFVCTCYALDMETQLVLTKWDSPLWNLLGIALFLIVLGLLTHLAGRGPAFSKKLLCALRPAAPLCCWTKR